MYFSVPVAGPSKESASLALTGIWANVSKMPDVITVKYLIFFSCFLAINVFHFQEFPDDCELAPVVSELYAEPRNPVSYALVIAGVAKMTDCRPAPVGILMLIYT